MDDVTSNVSRVTGSFFFMKKEGNMMFGMDGAAAHPKVNLKWRACM